MRAARHRAEIEAKIAARCVFAHLSVCAALATIALAYEEPAPKSELPRGQLRARDLPSSASPKVLQFPRAHAVDQPRTTARMSEGETGAKRVYGGT